MLRVLECLDGALPFLVSFSFNEGGFVENMTTRYWNVLINMDLELPVSSRTRIYCSTRRYVNSCRRSRSALQFKNQERASRKRKKNFLTKLFLGEYASQLSLLVIHCFRIALTARLKYLFLVVARSNAVLNPFSMTPPSGGRRQTPSQGMKK